MRKRTLFALAFIMFMANSCKNAATKNNEIAAAEKNTAFLKNVPLVISLPLLESMPGETRSFYKEQGNKTAWTNDDDRKAIINAVAEAESDGLMPEDYNYTYLNNFEALKTISKEECVRYDIMLTQSLAKLCSHLFKGKIQPSDVYSDWALPQKKLEINLLLTEAIKNHNITDIVNRCRPRHATYASLRNSLKRINSLPDDTEFKVIELTATIRLNDSLATVGKIKRRLAYWGDLENEKAVGNVYDSHTRLAVKKFQARHGIYPDGTINTSTVQELNVTKEERRLQLIANLERWRWFPYDFGKNAIVVNIPTYSLCILKNGKDTLDTYKVIVGKPDRRSPVLHSILSNLVVNPTWTVPPTYLVKDLVPAAIKDRNHFEHLNMKIMYKGEEVAPAEWDPEMADRYVYVQSAGDHNSLGRIKFNFSNSFYVYLHDTNHKEYFNRSYRALSSGCVRVHNPFKLAGYVLENENTGWDSKKLQDMVATNQTQSIVLKKTIQVHQLYWTAWMDKDGLQFRPDIYNLDKVLYKKLSRKS